MTMRATDILGKEVWHTTGVSLGRAHDIRLVQQRPFGQPGTFRITGIVVGRGSLGERLGYGSRDQAGPALLRFLLERRARHARYIPWEELQIEPDRIVVHSPVDQLRHPHDLEETGEH